MNVCSIAYLVFVGLAAVLYHALPRVRPRQLFLSAVNLAFLASLVPNWQTWAGLAAFIGGTYAALTVVRTCQSGVAVFVFIAVAASAFLVLKSYTIVAWLVPAAVSGHALQIVGLSYMLFKFIHMLVDEAQGQLSPFSAVTYMNYQLSFFTLIAGPIQRYNAFHCFWSEVGCPPPDERKTLLAWDRILTGMVKMGGVAAAVDAGFEYAGLNFGPQPAGKLLLRFAIYFYAFPVYLYFNFSGYTDIVIGSSRLFGFDLPENFNRPYIARNVSDFWNRWHMSLTHWIRDYVFMTSYKAVAERVPNGANYFGYGLIFSSLILAGVWHGSTSNFIIFGAIHGFGAVANQLYGEFLKSALGRRRFRRYQQSSIVRVVAVVLTFHYVCFSFLFFSADLSRTWAVLGAVWDGLFGGSRQFCEA